MSLPIDMKVQFNPRKAQLLNKNDMFKFGVDLNMAC